jgi:hypothetical protein
VVEVECPFCSFLQIISYMTSEQFLDVSWGRLLLLPARHHCLYKVNDAFSSNNQQNAGRPRVDASGQESKKTAGVVVRRTSQRRRHGIIVLCLSNGAAFSAS